MSTRAVTYGYIDQNDFGHTESITMVHMGIGNIL